MRSQPSSVARTDEADTPDDATHSPEARRGSRAGTALCLSGGGYRAALFHLGAARRLNELGILGGLRTVSGVSGGSIVANLLADPRLGYPGPGDTRVVHGFEEHVAAPLRALASRNVRTPALLVKLRPRNWPRPDVAVRALADQLADAVDWWDTPLRDNAVAGPGTITSATEVAYGVNWVFEDPTARRPHGRVGDYRVGYAAPPADLRIADVVAASCAYPPWFAPLVVDGDALNLTGGRPGLESADERARIRRRIRLTDGGIYDNLGLEPVWKSHRTVLVSDGGSVFRARTERTQYGRLLRILGIAASGGQSVRTRWLHASFARGVLDGASWALDSRIDDTDGGYPREVTELVNAVRTDLDAFTEAEQHVLERHGYLVADSHVRTHAAHLVALDTPLSPPHDDVADPAVAARALAESSVRRLLGRT